MGTKVNCYSWHQHNEMLDHRNRALQKFTLFGWSGDGQPDLESFAEADSGWQRIARVNTDQFFGVLNNLDRPAQQATSIFSARQSIGTYRYLLWQTNGNTFFGEFDVFGTPAIDELNK